MVWVSQVPRFPSLSDGTLTEMITRSQHIIRERNENRFVNVRRDILHAVTAELYELLLGAAYHFVTLRVTGSVTELLKVFLTGPRLRFCH